MAIPTPIDCADRDAVITPGDDPISPIPAALYIGTGGDVTVRLARSTADTTYLNVADGTILPIRAEYVRASSTADNILGLYNSGD